MLCFDKVDIPGRVDTRSQGSLRSASELIVICTLWWNMDGRPSGRLRRRDLRRRR